MAGALVLLQTVFACTNTGSHPPIEHKASSGAEREYLVTLQPWASEQQQFADSVARTLHGRVNWIYKGFKGFSIFLASDSAIARLGRMHQVKSMELSTEIPFMKK